MADLSLYFSGGRHIPASIHCFSHLSHGMTNQPILSLCRQEPFLSYLSASYLILSKMISLIDQEASQFFFSLPMVIPFSRVWTSTEVQSSLSAMFHFGLVKDKIRSIPFDILIALKSH